MADISLLDDARVPLKEILADYVNLERVRGPQLMARFYTEANFRVLGAQHDPPIVFTTYANAYNVGKYIHDFEDLLMIWGFEDQTLVQQATSTFDKMATASSVFGDVLRYDAALYLAMQWVVNPGPDNKFDPMRALVRDNNLLIDAEKSLGLSEKDSVAISLRFLKGSGTNQIPGRLDVYEMISGIQTAIQRQPGPMRGRRVFEIIFEQLHPRHLPRFELDKLWRELTVDAGRLLMEWNGDARDLADENSAISKRLCEYVCAVRDIFGTIGAPQEFNSQTMWNSNAWRVASVRDDGIPKIPIAQRQFERLLSEHGEAVNESQKTGKPVSIALFDELIEPIRELGDDDAYSPFFDHRVAPTLFHCGCIFAYLRFVVAGMVMPNTVSIMNNMSPRTMRPSPRQRSNTTDKLEVMTQYWVLRAYQTSGADLFVADGGEQRSVAEELHNLQNRWYLICTKGSTANQVRAKAFISIIKAILFEEPWNSDSIIASAPDLEIDAVAQRIRSLKVNN